MDPITAVTMAVAPIATVVAAIIGLMSDAIFLVKIATTVMALAAAQLLVFYCTHGHT